ncbi:MAG: PucR family transcriptional regulator [Mycobacteriaceae bacterium]|nr:PucR family transcriptional regulator [Mycobacteriaceae bacterium]
MAWKQPSPRAAELIRLGAQIVLTGVDNATPERFQAVLRTTRPEVGVDPVLAAAAVRSVRSSVLHWATANIRDPGSPVAPNLSPEALGIARDMLRRGFTQLDFRVATNRFWQGWMEVAFTLTADPEELRELLDISFQSITEFIDATVAGIAAQMEIEREALTRGSHAERLEVTELILDGAPIKLQRAEARLGYPLNRNHTGAVIWCDEPDADLTELDRVAESFVHAAGSTQSLIVIASSATRWVWVADATLDVDQIHKALATMAQARIAIGPTARGMDGFRHSHLDALTTQRMVARLHSRQRVVFFTDVQLVALITQQPEATDEFITNTLGELKAASTELQTTVLAFIKEQCNVSRTAKLLFTHRNTLLRRLERADQLLPRPLEQNSVQVAVALEALRWRGDQPA